MELPSISLKLCCFALQTEHHQCTALGIDKLTSGSVLPASAALSSLLGTVKGGGRCAPGVARLLAKLHFFLIFRPVGGLASSAATPLTEYSSFGTASSLHSSRTSSLLCL